MKLFPILIAASLAINAVLLTVVIRNAFSNSFALPAASPKVEATAASKPPATPTAEGTWAELQADDLAAQVERLRAEEFPPSVIRAIMVAQIRERFAARRKALEAAEAELPFWLANRDPKLQAEQRALAREEQKALNELLGPDPENNLAASLRRTLPDLPPEKIELLAQITERYNDQRGELYANARGPMLPDELQQIEMLEKAMRREVTAVLTPSELEDYDLRASRTAAQLRNNLAAFDPTEQEYRTLFRLQSAFDEQFGRMQPGSSQEQMRARRDAQSQLNEQIKTTLGPDRYAEYQRATDFNYRRTTQLVARLSLPPETANEIYAVQQNTQQRVSELRRPGDNRADRATQLRALATEAEAKLSAKLGASGFEAYKEYAGSWLTNIAPRPPPAPKQ